jgi:hypothetical protein
MRRSWLSFCILIHITFGVIGQQDSVNKAVKEISGKENTEMVLLQTGSDSISAMNKKVYGLYLIHEFLNDTIKMTPEGLKVLLSGEPSSLKYKLYRSFLLQFDTTDFSNWNLVHDKKHVVF